MGVGGDFRGVALEDEMVSPCKRRATTMAAEHKSVRVAGRVRNIAVGNSWRVDCARHGREYRWSATANRLVDGVGRRVSHHNCHLSIVAIFFSRKQLGYPTSFCNRANNCKNVLVGAFGLFIIWPIVQMTSAFGGMIQFQFTGIPAPTVGHQFLETIREQGNNPLTWGLVFTIVILGPLAEEIIWRGAIQQGLKQIGMPRVGAIVVTATMFALIHWGAVPEYGRAAAIPALAVFGVALGF